MWCCDIGMTTSLTPRQSKPAIKQVMTSCSCIHTFIHQHFVHLKHRVPS